MSSAAPLPVAAPSETGTDAAGIARFLAAIEADPTHQPHGLMLLRHGRTIAQGWWHPYTPDRRQLVYSLSKSFTAAAAGVLYDDGLLDLDRPVVSYFPEFEADITDERSRRILVRHAAAMATGHRDEMHDIALATDPAEPVRGLLLNPPDAEPGAVFAYNQPATYALAAIVQRLAGRRLVDLLHERVLGPIGAGDLRWQQYPQGRDLGFSGSFAVTETVARLGQLLLQRGTWDGRRVLSEEWVGLATSRQVGNAGWWGNGPESDWTQGYGFQHWISRHGFRGDGAHGQFCIVLPEHDAVLAIQGQIPDMQGLLNLAWEHLLPAFAGAGSTADDDRLAAVLAAAELPRIAAGGPGGAGEPGGADAAGWDGLAAEPVRGRVSATLTRDGAPWRLTLESAGGRVSARFVADGSWTVTEGEGPAVAVSAGFASPQRLLAEVAFLETPHSLRVEIVRPADPTDRTATIATTWVTEPLHDADPATLTAPPA